MILVDAAHFLIFFKKKKRKSFSGWPVCECPGYPAKRSGAAETDQLEVSECTLPGPSVGEITEDGVVASCHPLAWKENIQIITTQNKNNSCN